MLCRGLAFFLMAFSSQMLWAQLPATRLGSIFPPGASPGKTIEVTIAGADLDDVNTLQFSHPGITAKQKTAEPGPFEKGPQGVTNQFVVTLAANVPLGYHEVRAVGKYGVSNPRTFVVGNVAAAVETEPNNNAKQATEVTYPTIVHGVANATADVDCYKLKVNAGQRVIVDCRAVRIDSRMDAIVTVYDAAGRELGDSRASRRRDPLVDFTVPATGEYYIKVRDSQFRGGADFFYRLSVGLLPHIDFIFPPAGAASSNGQYTVYGRNLPGGQPAGLSVDGRPLQKITASIPLPTVEAAQTVKVNTLLEPEEAGIDGIEYLVKGPQGTSNPHLLGIATAPVVVEKEPNNTAQLSQKVTPPCEIAGQFYPRGDEDWITFDAKKGDVYTIEVISQRLGLVTDPSIVIQQVTTKPPAKEGEEPQITVSQLARVDDLTARVGGADFDARHDDPVYRFTAPADATYRVLLSDALSLLHSDPRNVYRLAIRPEKPDFRLVAVPVGSQSSLLLRKGGRGLVQVVAFRRDNFQGEIQLTVTGLPAGVTCPPVTIGPARNSATLVLIAADNAAAGIGKLQISGKSTVGTTAVTRLARFGSATWPLPARQGNQPQLSGAARLAQSIALSVSADESEPVTFAAGENKIYETSRAGIVKVPCTLTRRTFKGKVDIVAAGIPANIDAKQISIAPNATTGSFQLILKPNTPAGTYTFYLSGLIQPLPYSRNPEAAKAAAERKKEVDKIAADATAAAKLATTAKAAADKAATDTATAVNTATTAKTAADTAKVSADTAAKAAATKATAAAKVVTDTAAVVKAATAAKTTADTAKTAADAAAKVAATKATAAAKDATDTANVVKTATTAKATADTAKTAADAAAKVAADKLKAAQDAAKKDAANKALADAVKAAATAKTAADTAAKTAADKATVAAKALTDAQAKATAATTAKAAADKAKTTADAAAVAATTTATAAAKTLTDAQTKATAATTAKTAADKVKTDADAALVAATTKATAAAKALTDAQAKAKTATDAKVITDKKALDAGELLKAATALKAATDKLATDTANAAKPKNINNVRVASTPITIKIAPAPITLTAASPTAPLKQSTKVGLPVTIGRLFGFNAAVTVSVVLPPGVTGLSIPNAAIAAGQTQTKLTLTAAANATPGVHTLTIRTTMRLNNQNLTLDRPITLTVLKVVPPKTPAK